MDNKLETLFKKHEIKLAIQKLEVFFIAERILIVSKKREKNLDEF